MYRSIDQDGPSTRSCLLRSKLRSLFRLVGRQELEDSIEHEWQKEARRSTGGPGRK